VEHHHRDSPANLTSSITELATGLASRSGDKALIMMARPTWWSWGVF
jgi:hypothetical protein